MDSITKPVLYVHSPVQCDICRGHPAQQYCDDDECKEYICDNCIQAHNRYKTHHSDFLQRVLVSVVESRCYKPGHSERLADHICVSCREPLCDDCRDDHHDRGHPFTEIQSAVAAVKIKISKSLDQLKIALKQNQEFCATASDLKARVNGLFATFSKDVETNNAKVLRLVEEHGKRKLGELEYEKQQLLNELESSIQPLHDQTVTSSEVIFDAQYIIDCADAMEILSKSDVILQSTEEEVERARISDVLCLNPVKSRVSRMRMIPEETAYDLGQVRCMWKQVCSTPFSEAGKRSFLAPHPRGSFVLGASHTVPQPHTSAADLVAAQSQELVETSQNDTKVSFYADNGELTRTWDIGMLIGNEIVRGITVLPCGRIAVLGKHIQIYGSDLKFLHGIKPAEGHDWYSIAAGPSGSLLAGDCRNNCIDVLSVEGQISRSIPCSGVKPWQLHAFPSGRYVISQPGFQDSEPVIQILNPDGSIALSLSDSSWQYAYCSADSLGNLYIASLKMVASKEDVGDTSVGAIKPGLTFARYTHQGKREETILKDEIIENCVYFSIAAQKDGTQIALSSMDNLWMFR